MARSRLVQVVAYDAMFDLADADVRSIDIAAGDTEAALFADVIAAIPAAARPPATSYDSGLDTYPYAFDDVAGGIKALSLIKNIAVSALALVYTTGGGTFTTLNRQNRAIRTSAVTFTNDMTDLVVPPALSSVFNRVRITIHPKTVDASATTVLYAQTGTAPSIAAGASLTIWGSYTDPSDRQVPIGGTAVVTPLVATTDYTGNAAADGSGADRTADVSLVFTAFATVGKFVVTNIGATLLYLTKLQCRGKGVYDNAPQTYEASSIQTYGDLPLAIDMPYQDDPDVAQGAATYLEAQYHDLQNRVDRIEFVASETATGITQALTREPGDRITVTETVTGLASVTATIQSVAIDVTPSGWVLCAFGLAPGAPWAFWQMGTVGASEMGTTTVLGF